MSKESRQKTNHEDHIPDHLEELKKVLEEKIGLNQSFDVILREMEFASKSTGLLYLNGFAKDEVLTEIIKRLTYLKREEIVPDTLTKFFKQYIPHIQVEETESLDKAINMVMIGASALFIEKEKTAIIIDCKQYPSRSIEEPDLEKVTRGSRDGFNETLLTNVTLVRRRLRDPRLKLELFQVGKRTNTDICIAYVGDIADMNLVDAVRNKIQSVNIDGFPLADKQLEEIIVGKGWNPYPIVRYSERPDTIAAHLLEGHIVIFADTSSSAMILPTTFFHHVQHAEEYRQTPFVGTYLRWIRFFGIFASIFFLPMWFLFVIEPELLPESLDFIGPKEKSEVPILLQFIFIEIGVDLLRMAAVHTPSPLSTAMGIIAAILIGEIAVQAGLFVNEVILYMAVAVIGMFATPSYELSLANRIVRLILLFAVAVFKVPGLVVGSTLILIILIVQRSYNAPYMWPFIPFDAKSFFTILIRRPIHKLHHRPSITKPLDGTRIPEE